MILSNEDKKWLQDNYPLLKVEKNDSHELVIAGVLHFHAYYDEAKDEYTYNPAKVALNNKYDIIDSYEILVTSSLPGNVLPIVVETKGRILSLARTRKLKLCDLHVNEHGICCLCPKLFDTIQYPKGINILDFMYDLVVPFFYAQSYFEKYGDWPAGAYSHGDLGILEYYAEVISKGYSATDTVKMFFDSLEGTTQKLIINSAMISRQWVCLCEKRAKFRKCHPKAMNGLKQLKHDYDQYERTRRVLN